MEKTEPGCGMAKLELQDAAPRANLPAADVPIPPFKAPKIYQSVTELIGWTPLVEINHITKAEEAQARIVVKLEGVNPGCSIKDRIALQMIVNAEEKGLITSGVTTLIEPTGGNMGIALAFVGPLRGYKVVVVMPHTYSMERRMVMTAFGATIYLTDDTKGITGLLNKCNELLATIPNSHMLGQFDNPQNPLTHFLTTGPEIWTATEGKIDIFVSGCGTGGTMSGTGRYLKGRNPDLRVVAIEPAESPVMQGGNPIPHQVQGIGPGFIPANTDTTVPDEFLSISATEAIAAAKRLALEEGLLVGISSGAAFAGALKVAKRPENAGKLIVTILPSAGERYLSTVLFSSIKEECENMKFAE